VASLCEFVCRACTDLVGDGGEGRGGGADYCELRATKDLMYNCEKISHDLKTCILSVGPFLPLPEKRAPATAQAAPGGH